MTFELKENQIQNMPNYHSLLPVLYFYVAVGILKEMVVAVRAISSAVTSFWPMSLSRTLLGTLFIY